jgi:serine/threonine protein kinase
MVDTPGTYTGRKLGDRYELLRTLGMGGMGEVYLGRHIGVGRNVAVKILRSVFTRDEQIVKRFYREAQAAASVKHKNIVDILDVGVSDLDDPYIVMEYLEGESLGELLLRVGPIDLCAACAVMEPALEALQAAHDAGVVHRDLKPDNIFIVRNKKGPPEIKLIDFGISKFTTADKETRLTADGSLLGTPSYMSPEQSRGLRNIDGRADVYAMGVIMYEMLSGELPFDGDNYNAILIASLTEPPKPPSQAYAGFPFVAESIVMKALEKSRARRFESAKEMLDTLRELEDFEGRAQSLQLATRNMKNLGIAIGDLGYDTTTLDIEGPIAAEVLSDVLQETRTPEAWTDAGEPDKKSRQGKVAPECFARWPWR